MTPPTLLTRRVRGFRRFFEMGQEESVSPFLSEEGRRLSKNLSLKVSCLSALFLVLAYVARLFSIEPLVPFLISMVFLFVGSPALVAAIQDVFIRKDINIDVLMTLAAFGAAAIGYPMEGALLLVLFELSQSLEDMVTLRAKNSIISLGDVNPEKALCIDKEGMLVERALEDIAVGQELVVRSGEVVPIDGVILSGEASCSLAHMTGEGRPILFRTGEEVPSGARIVEGSLHIKTTVTADRSTLSQLIQLITRVHGSKPKLSQFFDQYGRRYATTIICLSAAILLLFPLLFGISFSGADGSFKRAMTFLITASPCALVLAIPISYVSALGAALKKGAILKGGIVFDQLVRCSVVAFDKTGTLTYGEPKVVDYTRVSGEIDEREALCMLASLEQYAVHPIARAIVEYAKSQNIALQPCENVHVVVGKGISGTVLFPEKPIQVVAGTFSFLKETHPAWLRDDKVVTLPEESELFVSIGGSSFYACRMKDTVREEARAAIDELRALQKRILLISGDREEQVNEVAWRLGITEVMSEASPEEKLNRVSSLKEQGLLMVGDGFNDAPALAKATVGVSMGSVSSASAREVSDVILLHDAMGAIPWLFRKATATRRVVYQNLIFASGALFVGTSVALFGLLPVWAAVFLHEGSTLLVGLNGLRLLREKK